MPDSIHRVQSRLLFVPPRYSPLVLRLVHAVVPLLLRVRTRPWLTAGIQRVEVSQGDTLATLFHQFQQGKIRLIIAFRHVEVDDPLCGLQLLSHLIPQVARQQNIPLKTPLHAHFVYERGMALWAGGWLNGLFSRMGGIPVRRGRKPDWASLRMARDLLVNGEFPLAIAPEGATNGYSERLGPLEPGGAQLGFWCVEDLQKSNRSESVVIVPVGIRYRYIDEPWAALNDLLTQLEQACRLPPMSKGLPDPSSAHDPMTDEYPRLLRLGEHLINLMEGVYRRFYHRSFPQFGDRPQPNPASTKDQAEQLVQRLEVLLDTALCVAEEHFGLAPSGNVVDRCRRVEEAGWTYIYRDDVENREDLPPVERGLADWIAQEASLKVLHMRLAESFVAVSADYIAAKPSVERFSETVLLMFDLTARLRGDKLPKRPQLGDRWVQMSVGQPLNVSDRWTDYKASRRQAVAALTEAMRMELERLMH
ncbi:MAG: 1-acyl-sn-glycerol-3-phosphate acyltransferase [Elainellaceae cyanobacterium]